MTISRSKINTWVPWMCCQKPRLWLDTMLLECHADKSQPEAPREPATDPLPAVPETGSISRVAHDDHDSDLSFWRCCGSGHVQALLHPSVIWLALYYLPLLDHYISFYIRVSVYFTCLSKQQQSGSAYSAHWLLLCILGISWRFVCIFYDILSLILHFLFIITYSAYLPRSHWYCWDNHSQQTQLLPTSGAPQKIQIHSLPFAHGNRLVWVYFLTYQIAESQNHQCASSDQGTCVVWNFGQITTVTVLETIIPGFSTLQSSLESYFCVNINI